MYSGSCTNIIIAFLWWADSHSFIIECNWVQQLQEGNVIVQGKGTKGVFIIYMRGGRENLNSAAESYIGNIVQYLISELKIL